MDVEVGGGGGGEGEGAAAAATDKVGGGGGGNGGGEGIKGEKTDGNVGGGGGGGEQKLNPPLSSVQHKSTEVRQGRTIVPLTGYKGVSNTLQHTATHCNALQRIATHCKTLQHTAAHMPHFFFFYNCIVTDTRNDGSITHTE